MIILGIDQSLTGTGLAVIECQLGTKPNHSSVLYTNTVETKNLSDMQRIDYIVSHVLKIVDQFTPVLIVMENYAFGAKGRLAHLGELGGAIKYELYKKGFTVRVVAPNTLKKFITGFGDANKELMMEKIESYFGKCFSDDNQADALGLALFGFFNLMGG